MAKKSAKDEGARFIEAILAKVPEDKRAAVKEALTAEPIVEEVGEHVLRQDEFSRMADETTKAKNLFETKYKENVDWFQAKSAELKQGSEAMRKLAELETKRKAVADSGEEENPAEAAVKKLDLSQYLTRADAEKAMQEAFARKDLQVAGYINELMDIVQEHNLTYKEKLDPNKLFEVASKSNKKLRDAYADLSADLRAAREKSEAEAKEKALEQKIRAKVLDEMSARGPYPVPGDTEGYAGIPTLTGLKSTDKTADYVKAAVDEYHKSQWKQ